MVKQLLIHTSSRYRVSMHLESFWQPDDDRGESDPNQSFCGFIKPKQLIKRPGNARYITPSDLFHMPIITLSFVNVTILTKAGFKYM